MTVKTTPSWSDLKTRLADLDRAGLTGLIQDLCAASKDNQAFLHARFALGGDVLKPYKATIDRWLSPDVFKNQNISVAKARRRLQISRRPSATRWTIGLPGKELAADSAESVAFGGPLTTA